MKLWERYGIYVVAVAVLLSSSLSPAGAAGSGTARAKPESRARNSNPRMALGNEGKRSEAEAAFNALAKDGTSGYRVLARFRAAAETVKSDRQSRRCGLRRDRRGYLARERVSRLCARAICLAARRQRFGCRDYLAHEAIARAFVRVPQLGARAHRSCALSRGRAMPRRSCSPRLIADPETPPSMRNRMQVMNALLAGQTGSADAGDRCAPSAIAIGRVMRSRRLLPSARCPSLVALPWLRARWIS